MHGGQHQLNNSNAERARNPRGEMVWGWGGQKSMSDMVDLHLLKTDAFTEYATSSSLQKSTASSFSRYQGELLTTCPQFYTLGP